MLHRVGREFVDGEAQPFGGLRLERDLGPFDPHLPSRPRGMRHQFIIDQRPQADQRFGAARKLGLHSCESIETALEVRQHFIDVVAIFGSPAGDRPHHRQAVADPVLQLGEEILRVALAFAQGFLRRPKL